MMPSQGQPNAWNSCLVNWFVHSDWVISWWYPWNVSWWCFLKGWGVGDIYWMFVKTCQWQSLKLMRIFLMGGIVLG